MNIFRELLAMLRITPAKRCPNCLVRAGEVHKPECPTGWWDGGVWG